MVENLGRRSRSQRTAVNSPRKGESKGTQQLVEGWAWCTDNPEIMEILHYWIGSGRNDEDMQIGEPFFLISSPDPQRIVSFWEDNDGGAVLTKGDMESYFDTPFDAKTFSNRRGSVLEAFARIEFMLDNLMLIACGVYSEVGNTSFTLATIRTMNVSRKITLLKHSPDFRDIDYAAIERLKGLRNQMAHQYSVMDVEYGGHRMRLGSKNGDKFTRALNQDYVSAIHSLFNTYFEKQDPVVQWLLDKLDSRK